MRKTTGPSRQLVRMVVKQLNRLWATAHSPLALRHWVLFPDRVVQIGFVFLSPLCDDQARQMIPEPPGAGDGADSFRLHYIRKGRRCVVSYDTLDKALQKAYGRLEKEPGAEVWISDAGKCVLLDAPAIRTRFAQLGQSAGQKTAEASGQTNPAPEMPAQRC